MSRFDSWSERIFVVLGIIALAGVTVGLWAIAWGLWVHWDWAK